MAIVEKVFLIVRRILNINRIIVAFSLGRVKLQIRPRDGYHGSSRQVVGARGVKKGISSCLL